MAVSVQANTAQPLPQTAAQALAQALRSGQVVEARVAGAGANGTTQLVIGNQLVDAALSVQLQPATLIHLLVQGSGPNIRLTVLLQTTPTPTPPPAQVQTPQAATPQPQPGHISSPNGQPAVQQSASSPQSSPQAPHGQTQSAQQAQPNVTLTANANTPEPPPQGHALPNARQAPAQTGAVNTRPVLVPTPVPSGVSAQGATAQPQSGQPVPQALVATGQVRPVPVAAVPQPAASPQIEPGTVLRLQFQGAGVNARPVLVPVTAPPGAEVAKSQGKTQPRQNAPALAPNPLQQALVQTVQQSVARQDSIVTLLTSLAGLGVKLTDLPKPVAQAGAELLAGRLNLNARPLDGAGLKAALTRSGVLFENMLQQGGAQALPRGDLKAALLNLRTVLRTWLGNAAPEKAASRQSSPPPPPTPRAPPRADRPVSLPLSSSAPNADTAAKLLGHNEAALARMRLVQISSLPETALRHAPGPAGKAQDINIELPLLFGGELSVGQFQIFRDGGGGGADGSPDAEWKMRFSINFSKTGEVGATVSLRGGKTGVMLWAEREETASVLQEMSGELADSLSARGLEPGVIRCRHGHPPQAQKPVGAFMDNCS